MRIPRFPRLGADPLHFPSADEMWFESLPKEIQEKVRPRPNILGRKIEEWIDHVPVALRPNILKIYTAAERGVGLPKAAKDLYNEVTANIPKEIRPRRLSPVREKASPKGKVLDKELKENIEALKNLIQFQEEDLDIRHPELKVEHIADAAKRVFDHSQNTNRLLAEASLKIPIADSDEDVKEVGEILSKAADSLLSFQVAKNTFKSFFSKELQSAQNEEFRDLLKKFVKAARLSNERTIAHNVSIIDAGRGALIKLSKDIKSKAKFDPDKFDVILRGINRIQEAASALSSMKGRFDPNLRKKAEETVLMAETMKSVINSHKSLTQEPRKYTPPVSFPELRIQNEKIMELSLATNLLKETMSKPIPTVQKIPALEAFANAAGALSTMTLIPENIAKVETLIQEASIPLRAILVDNLSVAYGGSPISILQKAGDSFIKWAIKTGQVPSFSEDEKGIHDKDLLSRRTAMLDVLTHPSADDRDSIIDIVIQNQLVNNPGKFIREVTELAQKHFEPTVTGPAEGNYERSGKRAVASLVSLKSTINLTKEGRFHPRRTV